MLFIDEIHRLHRSVEEMLYSAMEDGRLDILIGKGPTARSIRLELPAASRWSVPRPGPAWSRARCGTASASWAGSTSTTRPTCAPSWSARPGSSRCAIDEEGAIRISERSRGTPRVANRLLRRVRDFAEVRGEGFIDGATASEGLELFGVDELGLDKVDRAILTTLCGRFGGQPVGLTTLAQCVGEETDTIEDAYEPFLLQSGLIQRTARGRVATQRAWAHLGLRAAAVGRRRNEHAAALLSGALRRACVRAQIRLLARAACIDGLPLSGRTTRRKRGDQMAGMTTRRHARRCTSPWSCRPPSVVRPEGGPGWPGPTSASTGRLTPTASHARRG